jgi:hypothetical protein
MMMSMDSHEVLRCQRGDEIRIYNIRTASTGAQLWRVTEVAGEPARSIKECDLADPDEALEFLEEVRRALKAGGWQEL